MVQLGLRFRFNLWNRNCSTSALQLASYEADIKTAVYDGTQLSSHTKKQFLKTLHGIGICLNLALPHRSLSKFLPGPSVLQPN